MICLLAVIILLSLSANAKILLPEIISDNMVLQQKDFATLWGKGESGKTITVVTSWDGKRYQSKIDIKGNWKLKVKTPLAGGPFTLTFDDGVPLKLSNIMIGEVWLCSGQSNMEMPLAGWGKVKDYQLEIANAKYTMIRIMKVKKTISSYPLDHVESSTMGWQECSPATIGNFSATAYFFARKLIQNQHCAIGLIDASWGGTVIESWTSKEAILKVDAFKDSLKMVSELPHDLKLTKPNKPTLLYNGMINPLLPVALKGVIWYQGESNCSRAYQYRELFPLMINNWRAKFNKPKLPFLFVQLPNFGTTDSNPVESSWAELREAQSMALELANTGMAVTIDIGEGGDIHPKNKQDVGHRLALQAMGKVYNKKVICEGPHYESFSIQANLVKVKFRTKNSALKVENGKDLLGFAVAGDDKVFHWAKAKIDGDVVIVSSENVKKPVAVRYAWANNPVCNLFNEAGLPAAPFRTDKWPGLTINKR